MRNRPLPAVVVCHGYLANSGFLENPWAADLTNLGIAALFIDRRGHGQSPGAWWPPERHAALTLDDLYPDIRAAVSYLRAQAPLIDPQRIGLLGHSDGGTGVLMAASADWQVAATVSVSASVAPWEFVNHRAPRNLLLLYGREDRFILNDTDVLLLQSATRGYLDREGEAGRIADGSARRLHRIPGRGHVDVIFSRPARREALQWLAATFGIERAIHLVPLRFASTAAGMVTLVLLVLLWNGLPARVRWRGTWLASGAKLVVAMAVFAAGLALAGRLGPRLGWVPVEEGRIVAAVLIIECLLMTAVAAPSLLRRRARIGGSDIGRGVREMLHGAGAAAVVQLGLETTVRSVYTTGVSLQRSMLFAGLLGPSLLAFAGVCVASNWVSGGRGQIARGISTEMLLAGVAALLAPVSFVRMSMLPVYLLALVLVFTGAYRCGGRSTPGAAAFGAIMYARLVSVTCAFY